MDLREFVSQTLTQIIDGISAAQKAPLRGAVINPKLRHTIINHEPDNPHARGHWVLDPEHLKASGLLIVEHGQEVADLVEFDVAVTVEKTEAEGTADSSQKAEELKIQVASSGVQSARRTQSDTSEKTSNVTRVKFRIPVQFPQRR